MRPFTLDVVQQNRLTVGRCLAQLDVAGDDRVEHFEVISNLLGYLMGEGVYFAEDAKYAGGYGDEIIGATNAEVNILDLKGKSVNVNSHFFVDNGFRVCRASWNY